jgi:hypothetical protein
MDLLFGYCILLLSLAGVSIFFLAWFMDGFCEREERR